MNPEDKIYPPTSSKLKDLRDKGIIPFSYTAKRLLNFFYVTIAFLLFLPTDFASLFPLNISKTAETTLIPSDLAAIWLTFLIKIILTFSTLSFLTSLFLSSFLILPFKSYKQGNFKKNPHLKTRSNTLIALITLGITFSFLILLYQHLKTHNETTPLNFLTFNPLEPMQTYLITLNIFLIIAAMLLILAEKLAFYNDSKMSRAEILQEIKENEGSNITKQQIRENF